MYNGKHMELTMEKTYMNSHTVLFEYEKKNYFQLES